ncbi:hypothetical protein Trydic_g7190 [Trypoxylus dichotomus]
MAGYNFDYEEILKQLSAKDYVLEELEDHSSTYKYLFETSIDRFAEKKQTLQKLIQKKVTAETNLNSDKKLLHTLQEGKLKMDEVIKKQCEEIASLEKERDETVKNYVKTVDNLHDKLTSIENEFKADKLREQILELKQFEKTIENNMKDLMQEKQVLEERMKKLNKKFPNFEALQEIRVKLFCGNEELAKIRRELDNINKFINDLKSKLDDLSK